MILITTSSSKCYIKKVFAMSLVEVTVEKPAFTQNKPTSRKLVEFHLKEIHVLNRVLNGVIEVKPDALY